MNKIKTIQFKTDINGNKCLSIKFEGFRAFSIQTLGNLPIAHKATFDSVDDSGYQAILIPADEVDELKKYLDECAD